MTLTMEGIFPENDVSSRLETRYASCADRLAGAVLRDCIPYIPYDTGTLCQSGHTESVEMGVNTVIWDVPYARAVYYGDLRGVTFHKQHHPHATARWFAHAKHAMVRDWVALCNKD